MKKKMQTDFIEKRTDLFRNRAMNPTFKPAA